MKIKEAAALCGLTEKAIRLYEAKGLIHPASEERGGRIFRDYDDACIRELMTVGILFVGHGMAEVVSVVVVEDDISGELTTGTPVAVTGLIAKPWENEFNGQKKHGISFRAAALTSLAG